MFFMNRFQAGIPTTEYHFLVFQALSAPVLLAIIIVGLQ